MATAKLVCKSFRQILSENVWWYTYWSKRGVADIRAFKPSSVTWWELAQTFHEKRQKEIEELERHYPLSKKTKSACHTRGLHWSLLREFRCAIVDYDCSITNCSQEAAIEHCARLYSNLSVVHIKMANFPLALECVNKSLAYRDSPTIISLASALNNRAVALIHLGRVTEAMADLEISMEEDAKLANSRLHMAYCYFKVLLFSFFFFPLLPYFSPSQKISEFRKCVEFCDKAIALDPNYPAVYYQKAHALEALGLEKEAADQLAECTDRAYKSGPYKAIFVHLLPSKYPNYDW